LKAKLLALNQGQAKVAERLERSKAEKTHLTTTLTQTTEQTLLLRQEAEKLKPYAHLSPTALQSQLSDLPTAISTHKSAADALEKRTRALMTRTDVLSTLSTDLTSCISLTTTLSTDLAAEESDSLAALKRRDQLSTHTSTVREISRTEELLQRQLARWTDRTSTLHKSSAEKTEQARVRMEELRGVHKELKQGWEREGREVEVKKVRVEQLEKMMDVEREGLEEEVRSAREEFGKMESKIRLYVVEMEQAMGMAMG
jgi:kinetochore protein Nuf2